jgi:E3 ubiquitin-protein ligase HERC2
MSLPEASLFEAHSVSEVWLEVVERTSKFLKSVVLGGEPLTLGTVSAQPANPIPMSDRHTALSLLLEFAVLKGPFCIRLSYEWI